MDRWVKKVLKLLDILMIIPVLIMLSAQSKNESPVEEHQRNMEGSYLLVGMHPFEEFSKPSQTMDEGHVSTHWVIIPFLIAQAY